MAFRKNTAEAFEVLRHMAEQKKSRPSELAVPHPEARGGEVAVSSPGGPITQEMATQRMVEGTPTASASSGAGRFAGQREGRFQRKPLLRAPTPGRTLAGGPPRPSPAPPPASRRREEGGRAARPERPRSKAWAEWMGVEADPGTELAGRSAPVVEPARPPLQGAEVSVPGSSDGPAAPHDRERFAQVDARVDEEREALLVEGRPGDSGHGGGSRRPHEGGPAFLEGMRAGFFDDWSLSDGPDPLVRPRVDPVLLAARTRPLAVAVVPVDAGLEDLQALRIDVLPPAVPPPSGPERSPVDRAFETPLYDADVRTSGSCAGPRGPDGGAMEPPGRISGADAPSAPQDPGNTTEVACSGPPADRESSGFEGSFFRRAPQASGVNARAGSGLVTLLDRRLEMKLSTLLVLAMGGVIAVTLCLTYLRMPAPEDPYFAHRREGQPAGSFAVEPSAAGGVPSDVGRAGGESVAPPPGGPTDVKGAAASPGPLRQPIWSPASTPFPDTSRLDSVREEPPSPGVDPHFGSSDSSTGLLETRPPTPRDDSTHVHMIQVRARESHEGAQRILTYLEDFGFEDFHLHPEPRGLYTVFVGRFSDRDEAQKECQRLKRETRLRPYKNREGFFHDSLVITRRR